MLFWGRKLFTKGNLAESTERIVNPYRGFYQLFQVKVGSEADFKTFADCLVDSESLVQLFFNISAYREVELSQAALSQMSSVVDFFYSKGKNIIVRVAYDNEGKAEEVEPGDFELVANHCKQIADWLNQMGDKIFIYQGLLIGNWGEMHSSRYMGKGQMKTLSAILEEKVSDSTFLAVRRPSQYRKIKEDFPSSSKQIRNPWGLFNDAILGSETDMGTYSLEENYKWDRTWNRQAELDFQKKLSKTAPNGGETVLGDGYVKNRSVKEVVETLEMMNLTYLNRLYDRRVLDSWEKISYRLKGAWIGKSLYDYVEAHLGYRFIVSDADARLDESGTSLELLVDIDNLGFACNYKDIELEICALQGSMVKTFPLGEIKAGSKDKLKLKLDLSVKTDKKNKAKLFLAAKNKADGAVVHLANTENDNRVYLGCLSGYTL